MALSPLASLADLIARGLNISAEEQPIVEQWLDEASALIRDAAGSPISQTTGTVRLEGDRSPWLHLPGLPATAVSTVLLDGEPVTDYTLRGDALWRACGWQRGAGYFDRYGHSAIDVTYTHGLPEVPADIIGMVCRLVAQELLALRNAGGDAATAIGTRPAQSERIGDYSISYAGASGSTSEAAGTGTMALNDWQRAKLAARFGGGVGSSRVK